MVQVDNNGIIDGLWRGERKCIDPKAGDGASWIKFLGRTAPSAPKRNLGGSGSMSRHHRTKKDKKDMSHFEKIVTEGNEKAEELAKAGAMLDEGRVTEARAKTVQEERQEVHAALQYAASFHCLVEEWKDCERAQAEAKRKVDFREQEKEGTKHRTEVVCYSL